MLRKRRGVDGDQREVGLGAGKRSEQVANMSGVPEVKSTTGSIVL